MTTKPITAGSEIDAWCTRCKLELGHRVIAMIGPQVKRVVCSTCGSEHNYRAAKGAAGALASAKAQPRRTVAGQRKAAGEQKRAAAGWETLCGGRADSAFTPYRADQTFAEGDLLTHSRFGKGAVVQAIDGGKVRVVFRDGERTLIHGR